MGSGTVTRSLDIIIFGRDFLRRVGNGMPEDEEKWVTHFSRRDKVSSTSRGNMRVILMDSESAVIGSTG